MYINHLGEKESDEKKKKEILISCFLMAYWRVKLFPIITDNMVDAY